MSYEYNGRLFDDEGAQVVKSPVLEFESNGKCLEFTWANTLIRKFRGEPSADHIEFKNDNGDLFGITPPEGYMDMLEEQGFPMRIDPYIDGQSGNWYYNREMGRMYKALGELGLQ